MIARVTLDRDTELKNRIYMRQELPLVQELTAYVGQFILQLLSFVSELKSLAAYFLY